MKLLPFNNYNLKTSKILETLNNASRSLAELKGFANSIPNQHILINAITINESKDSCEIENIVTTHDSIYKFLTKSGFKDARAKEVIDYRNAIWHGYEIIKEKGFISTNVLVELQGMIEHNKAGVRKNPGTKLVNSKTGEVIYTPPQEEKEIRDLLTNLEDYINENDDEVDPLIKMALIHYQFESIHPFYDGNGRTGRIINILYLIEENLLETPILYLSKYIINTKNEYYRLFQETRKTNDFEEWIIYILKGIEETALGTIKIINVISEEMLKVKNELRIKTKIYSKELLEAMFFEFYTKTSYIEKTLGVSERTALRYLNTLVDTGFLVSEKMGRERIYKNQRLFDIIKQFESTI